MTTDPFQRFLGVSQTADPLALLGLEQMPQKRIGIENALRARLEQVYRHPAGSSDDAEWVRARLREAAAFLAKSFAAGANPVRKSRAA